MGAIKKLRYIAAKKGFLFRDDFTDTRAAGAVNGTPATPGPGTRSVIDAANRISIGSGRLTITQGASTWGDPELKYLNVPISRTFGRLALIRWITHSSLTGAAGVGFDNDGTGQPTNGAIQFNATNVSLQVGGTPPASLFSLAANTQYDFAIVLRSVGAYGFVKGGVFDRWMLFWVGGTNASATVYLLASSFSNTLNLDFVRVPQALYYVPILVYDTFTRANGPMGNSETTGPDGQSCPARAYSGAATWAVASERAVCTPATLGSDVVVNGGFDSDTAWTKGSGWSIGGGVATKSAGVASNLTQTTPPLTAGKWYTVTYTVTRSAGTINTLIGSFAGPGRAASGTYTDTIWANSTAFGFAADASFAGTVDNVSARELTLTELINPVQTETANILASLSLTMTAGISCGYVLRLDSVSNPQNFIFVTYDGSRVRLGKCVAGTYTNLIDTAATYSAGADLIVVTNGASVTVYYNNAVIGSTQTISDASILNNTQHALLSTGAGAQLDNFAIYARGNEGQYAQLDRYIQGS